ncbi:hypothetical protein [Nocardia sp. NPDC058666]|uniref:hypothetical protein n=1 Tax=Nocardia sp. NPDC058666 TaxID=3346587 RepID=UPI0036498218
MTKAVGVETPRVWQLAMRATTVVACLGIAVLLFELVTDYDLLALLVAGALLFVAGVAWMVLAPIGCAKFRQYRAVAIAPIVVAVGAGLVFSGLPDRLAWWLSEGSLTQAAQDCSDSGGDWFGVMYVDYVHRSDGGCGFSRYATNGGVAYFAPGTTPPDGPPQPYRYVYEPFAPNWYRYTMPIMHD